VELDERRARVAQMLDYRIANEPLSSLSLRVPRIALTRDNLQAVLDGEKLAWTELAESPETPGDASRGTVRIDLPSSRIGACRLELSYSLQAPVLKTGEPKPWSIVLATPAADATTSIERRTALVGAAESLGVEAAGESWQTDEEATPAVGKGLALIGPVDGGPLALSVTLRQPQQQNSSIVRQAWVLTDLTGPARRDRAVYRLATSDRQFRLRLPQGAQLYAAAVDGRELPQSRKSLDGDLVVDLPSADSTQRQYVVEIWYTFEGQQLRHWNRTSLELPVVPGAKWARRVYWQLALPRSEHLWLPPAQLTPELSWGFEPVVGELGYWNQRANLAQRELEQWIGASRQDELPAGTNQYLFSGFGLADRVEFVAVGRTTMLLAASGLILLGGLLLIYFPVLRHPALLLPVGLAAAAASLLFPEPAIQAAQAAAVGAVVIVSAYLLNWLVQRQRGDRAIVRGSSLAGREPNTTETRAPSEVDSQHSTASAALAIHVSEGESPR
jgi:hypothetical protein